MNEPNHQKHEVAIEAGEPFAAAGEPVAEAGESLATFAPQELEPTEPSK